MPQTTKILPGQQVWQHSYVAIFKCSPKDTPATQEIVIAKAPTIAKNPDLARVLSVLQSGMIAKREYPAASRPTIRFANFKKPDAANEARGMIDSLLNATSDTTVRKATANLTDRYISMKNVQKGVLIFLVSTLSSTGVSPEKALFIFKCDFEQISQLTPKQIFRRIEDAFEEQAKKGAQYPYFDGRKFDRKTVRVFDSLGETQYWLNFLELSLPPTETAIVQDALLETIRQTHPALVEKYGPGLTAPAPARPLAADERLIEQRDLLPSAEVKQVIQALPGDAKVSLSLDNARVSVPIKEYGQKWTIADQDGTHYILIKGAKLEVHDKVMTPFDLTKLLDLRRAAAELKMPIR